MNHFSLFTIALIICLTSISCVPSVSSEEFNDLGKLALKIDANSRKIEEYGELLDTVYAIGNDTLVFQYICTGDLSYYSQDNYVQGRLDYHRQNISGQESFRLFREEGVIFIYRRIKTNKELIVDVIVGPEVYNF